ncbi:phospholipase A2 inhibitor gamma subunit B-like [Pelodiscus sinensis]|uniref:phospholipase A2 inhibitor gamma subunit B-like n=1 Tax=Pelodiscus sinensis TaxID=13735 RepID=UPI003F6CD749
MDPQEPEGSDSWSPGAAPESPGRITRIPLPWGLFALQLRAGDSNCDPARPPSRTASPRQTVCGSRAPRLRPQTGSSSRPGTMKTLLLCCLLWALLETGTCVSCEVCVGVHKSCTGPVQVCSKELDSCGIIKAESVVGNIKTPMFTKACVSSSQCNLEPLYLSFGNGISISTNVACCVGEACKTATVSVPPANTTLNGRRCPACYSAFSHDCNEEIIDCTGTQTHCLHLSGTAKSGQTTVKTTMKGCASESACINMQQLKGTFGGIDAHFTTAECSPVSSRVDTVAPEGAGLIFSALLTVLLVNIVS